MAEAAEIAAALKPRERRMLAGLSEGAQRYDYDAKALFILREICPKVIEQHWTWVSSVRPGVERTAFGTEVVHCFQKTVSNE